MDRKVAHILVIPCMIQSHINPILQFSKRLASKNQIVTLIIPSNSSTPRFSIDPDPTRTNSPTRSTIRVEYISDGTDENEPLRPTVTKGLSQLIKNILLQSEDSKDSPPKVLVYDVAFPWAVDVAIEHGLHGAIFLTNCCAVNAVYCVVSQSGRKIPWSGSVDSIPEFPVLEESDLPSMVTRDSHLYPELMELVLDHFSANQKAKYHLYSSFMELEEAAVKWMRLKIGCTILTIGPTIPSMYLDKRIKADYDYGLTLFNPTTEPYTTWLDSKPPGSVIYISFGSLASPPQDQLYETASALKTTQYHFLWATRPDSDITKLPFSEKGMVVNWCSQLEVLNHSAIGCFVSHCGWNSVLEALSFGVPVVAMPQWADQPTIAKFVVDVWGVGVRVRVDEKGVGRREEIEACLVEVMEGEKGKEMKKNALRFRKLAVEAVGEGGSSDNNIEEFIASL